MDFTRDPIIETIISPKDGYKLSVRNPRATQPEEYLVNALEVVSFGSALFFRSLEKPKAFLLPITDYEVVEVKEARMVLKNVSLEKPIKIGDGKDSKGSDDKESSKKDGEGKKSSKKRTSKKKRSNPKAEKPAKGKEAPAKENAPKEAKASKEAPQVPQVSEEGGEKKDEADASSSVVPIVFPTPPKIIGRKLPTVETDEGAQGDVLPNELEADNSSKEASQKSVEKEPEVIEKKEDQEAS